jgi:hypothetical protein
MGESRLDVSERKVVYPYPGRRRLLQFVPPLLPYRSQPTSP